MDKRFWAIVGVIVLVFAGFLMFSNKGDDQAGATKPTNHVTGKASSKVKLVEYGDYQCPYCGQYFPIVQQVVEKYKDKISFRFANLPLNQVHANAYAAARAAEAAANQGKFWEMHDQLYQTQQSWAASNGAAAIFETYATQLHLDMTKFKADVASGTTNEKINADKAEFNKTKLQLSTPTFLLNGKQIKPLSVDDFSKAIDAELKKQASNS